MISKKVSFALLGVFLGTAVGALSGHFVWALVAAAGAATLVSMVQNLSGFQRAIDGSRRGVCLDKSDVKVSRPSHSQNWLQQWDEEVTYSQVYEDTPGSIWNRSLSASDH